MFLPIMTLTLTSVAGYSRYMRSSALDALAQDYIRLARAKGCPSPVLRRHLVRNASLSMITLIGLSIPALLGGNLIVENLFNSHGLGLLFINELNNEDYPTVIALVLIGGCADGDRQLHRGHRPERGRPAHPDRVGGTCDQHRRRIRGAAPAPSAPEGGQIQGPRAGWRLALSSFVENKLAVVGSAIIVFFVAFCFLGPFVYHTNQIQTNVIGAFHSPGERATRSAPTPTASTSSAGS
jgi:hypothetical protein